MDKIKFGISDIAIYLPQLYLDTTDLADERGIPISYYKNGLGIDAISVFDRHDDTVSLGVMAALRLIEKNCVDPRKIGRASVATESGVDEAIPNISFILGLLEKKFESAHGPRSFMRCDTREYKNACIAVFDALEDSLLWLEKNPDKYALVIATDLAKYKLASGSEGTQGGGAAAILLEANPRLLEIDASSAGLSFKHSYDFRKPLGSKLAFVEGGKSVDEYIEGSLEAIDDWKAKNQSDSCILDKADFASFHLPCPKVVEKASAAIILNRSQADEKSFRQSDEFKDFFKEKIEPSTLIGKKTGNNYNGSSPQSLYSFFTEAYKSRKEIAGKTIALGFFGSGRKAKYLLGTISERYKEIASRFNLDCWLSTRKRIDFQTYEALHNESLQTSVLPPHERFVLFGQKDGFNIYGWQGKESWEL